MIHLMKRCVLMNHLSKPTSSSSMASTIGMCTGLGEANHT